MRKSPKKVWKVWQLAQVQVLITVHIVVFWGFHSFPLKQGLETDKGLYNRPETERFVEVIVQDFDVVPE